MFKNFFKFVGENKSCRSIKDFINAVSGKSYLNGMYRFFEKNDIDEWNDIVGDCFPKYKDTFSVLSYDWMGRIFALEKKTNMVILFEPGTGDVYDTDADIIKFHDELISQNPIECLVSDLFEYWYKANDYKPLAYKDCGSYKVPLFLGGKDELGNLDICDMEVYWEIMMPLMNL